MNLESRVSPTARIRCIAGMLSFCIVMRGGAICKIRLASVRIRNIAAHRPWLYTSPLLWIGRLLFVSLISTKLGNHQIPYRYPLSTCGQFCRSPSWHHNSLLIGVFLHLRYLFRSLARGFRCTINTSLWPSAFCNVALLFVSVPPPGGRICMLVKVSCSRLCF